MCNKHTRRVGLKSLSVQLVFDLFIWCRDELRQHLERLRHGVRERSAVKIQRFVRRNVFTRYHRGSITSSPLTPRM